MDDLGDLAEANRFHQYLVCLKEDSCHGGLEHGVVAEHQSHSVGLCVAHRVNYGKTITGIRHVKVGEQDIEVFRGNKSQGFANGGGGRHGKPLAF